MVDIKINKDKKFLNIVRSDTSILPVLKWAGGKRWFVKEHSYLLPKSFLTYREPFFGGGAVFFALAPDRAVISDINSDLIDFYLALKNYPNRIESDLKFHQAKHSASYYKKVRAILPLTKSERTARFLYLNRSCWNGLYRVNQKGQFNVPMGTRTNFLFDTDDFSLTSKILNKAEIKCMDFEENINEAKKNDFLFVDPPYTVKHNNNGFVKYNQNIFTWDDQERLAKTLIRAKNRGVKILLTNANHRSIRDLYRDEFEIKTIKRKTNIAAFTSSRGITEELAILSYKV